MHDPRAGHDMVPDEVWDNLPPDPEIVALEAEREWLKGGQFRIKGMENKPLIRELTKLIRAKKLQRQSDPEGILGGLFLQLLGPGHREADSRGRGGGVCRTSHRSSYPRAFHACQDPVQPGDRLELYGAP